MPQLVHSFTFQADHRLNTLLTPVKISQAFDPRTTSVPPKAIDFDAIWDTGATGTVISQRVVERCELTPIGMATVHHAGGQDTRNVYLVNIMLVSRVGLVAVRVTEGRLMGADVLIGMDIISQGDFALTNKDGKTTFSFRIPSTENIEFAKGTPLPLPHKPVRKVGRNDPCPCGSGKKYKKCCGQ